MLRWMTLPGAMALAAWLLMASSADAGPPGVLVSGDNLPANVDPHQIFDVPMQLFSLNTYDNLYRYQGNPPKLEPWLAQSHSVSQDGLTWEFKLRPGAKFHDGSEITAEDVVYSFKRVLALLQGSVDLTDSYLPTDQVERIEKSKGVHIEKNTSMRIFTLRKNNMKPPLDNINARKCLAHAFNYDGFIKEILKGYAERNPAPLPNNLWGYPKDVVGYEYDLKKAKTFCDKAKAEGAPMNRPLEIHTQSQLEQTNQAAQLFQSDLAQIGVTLKIIADTWANITTNTAKPQSTPDLWVHWVSTYFVDPENWVGQMYDSQFQGTWKASAWYQNPRVDDLLRKARSTIAQAERQPLYEEAVRLVVADSPDIWVYNTVEIRGVTDRVKGFRFSPVGSGGEMRWVKLEP